MKKTYHKNGDVSFRLTMQERTVGAGEHSEALRTLSSALGGPWATIGAVLKGEVQDDGWFSPLMGVRFGTETLSLLMEICERVKHTPYGQGCFEKAMKRING